MIILSLNNHFIFSLFKYYLLIIKSIFSYYFITHKINSSFYYIYFISHEGCSINSILPYYKYIFFLYFIYYLDFFNNSNLYSSNYCILIYD